METETETMVGIQERKEGERKKGEEERNGRGAQLVGVTGGCIRRIGGRRVEGGEEEEVEGGVEGSEDDASAATAGSVLVLLELLRSC
jgi:hypothetical protein